MKQVLSILLLSVFCFIGIVLNASIHDSNSNRNARELSSVRIIELENTINKDGGYKYKTYLDNGISQDVKGNIKEVNGTKIISVTGSYSYILPTGEQFTVTYVADEKGYKIKSISQTMPDEANDTQELRRKRKQEDKFIDKLI